VSAFERTPARSAPPRAPDGRDADIDRGGARLRSRCVIPLLAALALPLAAAAQAKGRTEVTWYGHAAFVVKTPAGTVLAIDPFFQNPKTPIGGHFTMDPQGAALAASYVKARTVVPMHFGTFPALAGTPQQLEAALAGRAKVMVLEPGKPASF